MFASLAGYDRRWLRNDVIAGLTVWAVRVPEAFVTGVIALLAGLLRLGFLANFISGPQGFTIGLALTIIIGQVPKAARHREVRRQLLRAGLGRHPPPR